MKELNSRSENIKRNETPKCYESKTCWIEKISHTNYMVQKISHTNYIVQKISHTNYMVQRF